MIEELKKNRDLTVYTGVFIGSAIGYKIGVWQKSKELMVATLWGGFIGRVLVEILLKD